MYLPLYRLAIGFAIGGLMMIAPLRAQEIRFGFVKTERILRETNSAKAAQVKLESEFSKREKDLTDQNASLKSMIDKLQIDGPTLSQAQSSAQQKLIADSDRELQRKRRSFQEDLNVRKNEELQKLIGAANEVIKQVGKNEKYDLILQDAVYVDPKYDLTEKVIGILNSQNGK